MDKKTIQFQQPTVRGEIVVPGDKSISHRAIMLGAIAKGRTEITGFLDGEDCLRTIDIFRQLGVQITQNGTQVIVESPGIAAWEQPKSELYAGNSGTTARLMLGILAGSTVTSVLTGDASLSKRPMNRVTLPLAQMGAAIQGTADANLLPLTVTGQRLKGIHYALPVASAQVKSAILFAGLQADGETSVEEQTISRDHTERMLEQFGANIQREGNTVIVKSGVELQGQTVHVPGDISSAAFFLVAAALVPNSSIRLANVGLNPTRTGILDILQQMGADITIETDDEYVGEPFGTVDIQHQPLRGVEISGELIPRLIDELPIIALLATQAEGQTIIRDAAEMRVKETDRIAAVTTELKKLGANIEATEDGMIIQGPTSLHGAQLASYGDHRIGMMASIAALIADGPITIEDPACIRISYPSFFEHLSQLTQH